MAKSKKSKGGKPPIQLTQEQKDLVAHYAKNGVPVKYIAELLGICRKSFYNVLDRDPELLTLYRRGQLQANIQVSEWLFESCRPVYQAIPLLDQEGVQKTDKKGKPLFEKVIKERGSVEAQKFWMRTRAGWKDRYYLEVTPPIEEDIGDTDTLTDEDIKTIVAIGRKMEEAQKLKEHEDKFNIS